MCLQVSRVVIAKSEIVEYNSCLGYVVSSENFKDHAIARFLYFVYTVRTHRIVQPHGPPPLLTHFPRHHEIESRQLKRK